ncbi:hypothetical protein Back11_25120 [Paenibacillus baekrokdamisoli]|uniref:Uncharacterized protein n=1 Tax=Paenibacillus baekrokdamisoli TaxID=1712516 RepID=A0A3G9IQL2_9BACL|nr:hypothetical protein [Paenibacillus baekrokdamisoli]MBB3070157.1 hypothetical protein [Paenibacillus baekrokdamisoli]BBH21167.1 hypothetical protein Back11_25120 [Paenibacillus baekrokdamisoli]
MRKSIVILVGFLCLSVCSGCLRQEPTGTEGDEGPPSVISVVYPSDVSVWDEVYGEPNINHVLTPSPIHDSAMKEQRAPLKSDE